ncbi:MAG: hypothetical protein MI920_39105 [Kiloniellales bacterium]|nr:hypothetical protein [Kiloniellales bacterium]
MPAAACHRVLQSINAEGDTRCVDILVRPDGTFGCEEYRREPEENRGWFPVGFFAERVFDGEGEALSAARARVPWLSDALVKRRGR